MLQILNKFTIVTLFTFNSFIIFIYKFNFIERNQSKFVFRLIILFYMNQSLLKQILQEYEIKRTKAIYNCEQRKKELLTVNPHLEEIENELSKISIQTAKAILISDKNEKEKALKFIENFDDPNEKNLLFTGNTGLGKTFLTNCIASEILKQGKNVLYQTAPVMLDTIIDEKFGKADSKLSYNVLDVDLLIIDDLGAETQNNYKIEQIFNIINTRLLNQNHKITKTIISTNLTIEEIFKTYTNRIGSRLAGNYRFLRFFGEDLRFKKSKKDKQEQIGTLINS